MHGDKLNFTQHFGQWFCFRRDMKYGNYETYSAVSAEDSLSPV